MLGKKQYWVTLGAAVIVFFLLFILAYFYISQDSQVTVPMSNRLAEEPVKANYVVKEERILPSTRITLSLQNNEKEILEQTSLNATSLLGLTEDELKARFKDYHIDTFNEDEVYIVKTMNQAMPEAIEASTTDKNYVLGVDGEYICIKEEGQEQSLIRLERKVTDFSSHMYSLLLKENIHISEAQKEMLVQDVGALEKILQDYVGE